MNMAVIVFWMSSVAIVVIGVGVIYSVIRDLMVNNRK
jgi:cytochrome c-type biogenesis protein CcmH/NrfF